MEAGRALFRREAQDAYDVTEWFARQPWCNGRVGMFGRSYMGVTQYLAAGTIPPHLKAIMPEMGTFDLYSSVYSGGIFRSDYATNWGRLLDSLDGDQHAAPVDNDQDGSILAGAIKNHKANADILQMAGRLNYRDSRDAIAKVAPYLDWDPSRFIPQIDKSGIAIYHVTGWFDLRPRDAMVWFDNLKNPQKLLIGPWFHTKSDGLDIGTERLRWFDYWLKGIDNGIMTEAPIHYYTIGASPTNAWRSAIQWPLPTQKLTPYYFQNENSTSSNKIGILSNQQPETETGQDDSTIDYSATSGIATRWTNGYAGPSGYRAMTSNDEKAVTYTTLPLASSTEVTGHPIAHLWISSTASDEDVFVYLEDVDEQGSSHYVTEGTLRASHRSTSVPGFNYLGLPYHRSFSADVKELPKSEPVELAIDLSPISYIFARGHRIRIAITGADKDNAQTTELSPPPVLSIYRTVKNASHIILPIIPTVGDRDSESPISQAIILPSANTSMIWRWRNLLMLLAIISVAAALISRRRRTSFV